MATSGKRGALRVVGCGCACLVVVPLGFAVWVGLQLRAASRPVVLDGVHPFRSEAAKERYLEHYDAWAQRWPVPSRSFSVETSWGPTFVRISGPEDGPPMVLVPGANATSLMFEPNVASWSERTRVFAVDNVFDFGRSIYTRSMTTPDDFVDWLDELLVRLGLEDDVNLLGHSYGGWIAAEYGLAHPERLRSVILAAPAGTIDRLSDDFIMKGLQCLIPHPHFVKAMVRWALHDAADGTPEQQRVVEEAADNAWLGLRCFKLKQLVPPRVLSDDEWRRFEVPVLFLVGENEVIYSISGAEAVARINRVAPEIDTELFPDCGHDLTFVQAERFNRRVLRFIDGTGEPARASGDSSHGPSSTSGS